MSAVRCRGISCGLWIVAAASLVGCAERVGSPQIPQPDLVGAEAEVIAAVQADRDAVREAPRSAPAWGRLGERYRAQRWLREAAACYAQAHELDPHEFRWAHLLGKTLRLEDGAGAARAFARAVELDPSYAPTRLYYGQTLVRLGREEQAREQFELALETPSTATEARVALGQIELSAGNLSRAESLLRRALQDDPADGRAHLALARIETARGETGSAARHAELSRAHLSRPEIDDPRARLTVEPVGSHGLNERGLALLSAGRTEEALPWLRRAVEASPDRVAPRVVLGIALARAGLADEAAVHLRKAVWQKPGDAQARAALGKLIVTFETGELDEAQQHLERAVALRPDDGESRYYLARVLESKRRPVEAEQEFGRVLAIAQDSVERWMSRGSPDAEEDRQRLARDRSLTFEALIGLGRVRLDRGDAVGAASHLQDALRLDPQHAGAHLMLGDALAVLGRTNEARARFRQALALRPDCDEAKDRLRKHSK